MSADAVLWSQWLTNWPHVSMADAARNIAHETGLSADSVRGRLSRSRKTSIAATLKELAKPRMGDTPAIEAQRDIIKSAREDLKIKREQTDTNGKGVFLSDIHFPFARWDALELAVHIIEDVKPDYISAENDLNDNEGFGRWNDDRTPQEKVWSSDINNQRGLNAAWFTQLRYAAPKAMLVGVTGNHDRWLHNHHRANTPQTAEQTVLEYMKFMQNNRVMLFSDGKTEPGIEIAPGLVWWHGQFTQKSPVTRAKRTIQQFMDRGAKTVIVGHTHRPVHLTGDQFDYPGYEFVNAPCLSRLKNIPYLRRDPVGWSLGIVVSEWSGNDHHNVLVRFEAKGDKLMARYNGRLYETELLDND